MRRTGRGCSRGRRVHSNNENRWAAKADLDAFEARIGATIAALRADLYRAL